MVGHGCTFVVDSRKIHCTEMGLHMTKRSIGIPQPKTFVVDVFKRNGQIDLTDYVNDGNIKYNNRTIKIEFEVENPLKNWNKTYHTTLDTINGKVIEITFDDDAYYAYRGRVKIDRFSTNSYYGIISIIMDCEPYMIESVDRKSYLTLVESEDLGNNYFKNHFELRWKWDELSFVDGYIRRPIIISKDKMGQTWNYYFPEYIDEVTVRFWTVYRYFKDGSGWSEHDYLIRAWNSTGEILDSVATLKCRPTGNDSRHGISLHFQYLGNHSCDYDEVLYIDFSWRLRRL